MSSAALWKEAFNCKPMYQVSWADREAPARLVDRDTICRVIRQHREWKEPITRTDSGYVLSYGPLEFVIHRL